ncbi:hypothetical protein WA026_018644 [Henosepilachna vigintioctopunctata]|uniref:Thyroglobulin type-1 domain-containing protein n=1 Tax=Henosepilachna vigintioctopunctata TaxID=420089 RepID=A0AAW1UA06_9CUCU
MIFKTICLLTFIIWGVLADEKDSIYCTTDFCEKYPHAGEPPCSVIPPSCNITNSLSGIYLPSPTTCNCCEYCIGYLSEGQACATGKKTTDTPSTICGSGLYCDLDRETCRPISNTPCTKAQAEYDNRRKDGKMGDYEIRPKCDDNGDFVPYHCTPGGICYCVDKEGKRIFGSIANDGKGEYELPCDCSRNHKDMGLVMGRDLRPGEYLRCASNGAYEPLQCLDEKTCICVDEQDGTPAFDGMLPVEIWAIDRNTLSCFDPTKNVKGSFYRRCEEVYMNKSQEISDSKKDYDLVLAYELPNCTPDGNYAPVQEDHKYKFCSTPEGIPLIRLEKKAENKKLRDEMNCKCAMARRLIKSNEKPSCLENGNYNPEQCRRGYCYTVDEDGNQIMSTQ